MLVVNITGMGGGHSFSHSDGLTSSMDELLAALFVLDLDLRPHLMISNTKYSISSPYPHPVLVVEEHELPGCHPLEDGVGLVIGNLLL